MLIVGKIPNPPLKKISITFGVILTLVYICLQSADDMFRAEEYTAANNLLEEIISYLHYVAHPCFNLTDVSTSCRTLSHR